MKKFNLSDFALNHRSLLWYFMAVFVIAGTVAFLDLGREEDPPFTIRKMIVSAQWPGASASETTLQVTERIERALQDIDTLKSTQSTTTAGQAVVTVELEDTVPEADVKNTWQEVRSLIGDLSTSFPQGVRGPFFNDHFGDVFGNIYAFTADGLSDRQLLDYVKQVRSEIYNVPNVGSVEILGARDEVVYLDFSVHEVAALGVSIKSILLALADQNSLNASGVMQAGPERIAIGQPAIGLAIGMRSGKNLLEFGAELEKTFARIEADLPVGVETHLVADQPKVVDEAVSGFTKALFEAIVIVLVVSFVSLGMRAGFVVATSIPLVLAITFLVMSSLDISLQRVSLGGLIIALGLLVDDAMIAVEMMVKRLEEGRSLRVAATSVYTSTAFPMLSGTLVTVAGFIPIGLNSSSAGEFTFSLFIVLAVSLLVSWVVAVLFTPLLGVSILPKVIKHKHEGPGIMGRMFSGVLRVCMRLKWLTLVATLVIFGVSVWGFGFVEQQFFPSSDRPELIIDFNLPQNASIAESDAQIAQFEREALAGDPDIAHWSSYVGRGAPRFVLTHDGPTAMPSVGQLVVVTSGIDVRDAVQERLTEYLRKTFPGTDTFIKPLSLGPPVKRPVQYRVSGPDIDVLRSQAQALAGVMLENPNLSEVRYDWMEPARTIEVEILYDKARQLGITSQDIAQALSGATSGGIITQIRDRTYLVNVVGRANLQQGASVETMQNLQITTATGSIVPLAAVAQFHFKLEQPMIMRRDRVPTLTLSGGILGDLQAATVVSELEPEIEAFRASLPLGYSVELGGTVESSAESQAPIVAAVPLMLFVIATVLMLQLQSFARMFLVVAVAPLAVIGVVVALLSTGKPMGFVALLGILALIGILIRNSVILVVQIEELRRDGMKPWDAVREATEGRVRPIMLTALAASLGLLPITREIFWGPMAYAMMGGIIVGTLLTLIVLPALYLIWFGIKPDTPPDEPAAAEVDAEEALPA
ncbi:MAG: efflux RND transporter permease subunit [Maritimibacter sp.]